MTQTVQPNDQQRADQIADDIERLAAFARANPDIANEIGRQRFLIYLSTEAATSPKEAMASIARRARRAGATMAKAVNERFAAADLTFGGLELHVYADREEVCERVVVGTHEETIEEKDPEALAKVPTVKTTRTVEDIEWRCTPLLAEQAAEAAS